MLGAGIARTETRFVKRKLTFSTTRGTVCSHATFSRSLSLWCSRGLEHFSGVSREIAASEGRLRISEKRYEISAGAYKAQVDALRRHMGQALPSTTEVTKEYDALEKAGTAGNLAATIRRNSDHVSGQCRGPATRPFR